MGRGKKRVSVPQSSEDKIKQELVEAQRRKRAKRVIGNFRKQFPDHSLVQILAELLARCSDKFVAKVLIERIEQNQKEKLNFEERAYLQEKKTELEKEKGEKKTCLP